MEASNPNLIINNVSPVFDAVLGCIRSSLCLFCFLLAGVGYRVRLARVHDCGVLVWCHCFLLL
ncbi:hypothetical protein AKO1_003870 [Acrasis kona]|uniref:Uncharacterized protein n=1 Tax=Acrasis kona TaxID=1008807 RepID=A0AAW2ZJ24_9EUKA